MSLNSGVRDKFRDQNSIRDKLRIRTVLWGSEEQYQDQNSVRDKFRSKTEFKV